MTRSRPLWLLVFVLCGAGPAASDPPNADVLCADDAEEASVERLLRAWSLDVRGVTLTLEEYARVEAGEAPEVLLDEWLASEAFPERAVRRHRELFWPNLGGVGVLESGNRLTSMDGSPYYREGIAQNLRGQRVPCLEVPAEFDDLGRPVLWPQEDGTRLEGYVEVQPWWDPTRTLEVCALDAQVVAESSSGSSCATQDAWNDVECGCGPDLQWCWGGSFDSMLRTSFAAELEHRVRDVISRDAPYTELLVGDRSFVNGPIAYFWRHLAAQGRHRGSWTAPTSVGALPELAWDDTETWVAVEGPPELAGVFTSPGWLLRFQTQRSRANRFYNSFLCTPFSPPAGGIQSSDDAATYTLDLQVRDGCDYCHARLEPAAAAWGRWGEAGVRFLEPDRYPELREDCQRCAENRSSCPQDCRNHYVVDALSEEEIPYLGVLRAYEFRREEHGHYVEEGPGALVEQGIADRRIPRCSVEGAAASVLGREILSDEGPWIEALMAEFMGSNWSYRALTRAVLVSDTYRRIR